VSSPREARLGVAEDLGGDVEGVRGDRDGRAVVAQVHDERTWRHGDAAEPDPKLEPVVHRRRAARRRSDNERDAGPPADQGTH
jgi:hypothetical protein